MAGIKTFLKWAAILGGVCFLILGLAIFVLVGGRQDPLPGASNQIVELGFMGALERAETTDWKVSAGGGTSGGPNSNFLVGPGALELDGNRIVQIDPETPGGTFCPELPGANSNSTPDDVCLILGNFKADGVTAEWFSAQRVDFRNGTFFVGRIVDFQDGRAVFDRQDVSFLLDLAPNVTFKNCGNTQSSQDLPDADVYLARATSGDAISIVECVYDFY